MSTTSHNQWREASTLIIVTHTSLAQKIAPSTDGDQKIIVISEFEPSIDDDKLSSSSYDDSDYRILEVKRSSSSSFMASAHVFPGGAIEKSDFSPKWWQIFSQFGLDKKKLTEQMKIRIPGARPSILEEPLIVKSMKDTGQWTEDHLSPDIAFRIAAIRETFEETGKLSDCIL